jgi:hypothetical protein
VGRNIPDDRRFRVVKAGSGPMERVFIVRVIGRVPLDKSSPCPNRVSVGGTSKWPRGQGKWP